MIVSLDIDAQKTFTPLCPDELPVLGGADIAHELNEQAKLADLRVMTKDAHSQSALWVCEQRAELGQPTGLKNAPEQWLPHAIVGSYGFELLDTLPAPEDYDFCVWKGIEPHLHPYGACFHDLGEKLSTGLLEWLAARGTKVILVGGLATDYCVKHTVLQLLKYRKDWEVWVNVAACRGIDDVGSQSALVAMEAAGARLFSSAHDISIFLV